MWRGRGRGGYSPEEDRAGLNWSAVGTGSFFLVMEHHLWAFYNSAGPKRKQQQLKAHPWGRESAKRSVFNASFKETSFSLDSDFS